MKNKITNWLKYDRKFNTGLALYYQHGNNLALKKTFNRQGENPFNLQLLQEELRKLAVIEPDDFRHMLSIPVHQYKKEVKEEPAPVVPEPLAAEKIDPTDIQCLKSNLPDNARKAIRIREEFPFLKETNCPPELKILVSDMLTAYDTYRKAHEDCFTAENEAQLLEYARATVENFIENRLIWEELNHYKTTGEILGKHPIFEELRELSAIRSMNATDLAKMKGNLRSSITKLHKALEKGDKPELNEQRHENLSSKERLLVAVENELTSR